MVGSCEGDNVGSWVCAVGPNDGLCVGNGVDDCVCEVGAADGDMVGLLERHCDI